MLRCLLILCFCLTTVLSFSQPKQKKAVFVILDGISFDVIQKLDPPHLRRIAEEGGFAKSLVGGEKDGYSQTPTISAVGYNSVLTGTWVNKHNVWDNDIAAPNYYYPTIFRLLKTQWPQKKTGIFSSWTENRTRLVGDGITETGGFAVDYKFDGLELDTINFPQDENRDFMHRIDEKVADEAAETIRTKAPDLSWVYLEYTDDMGHMHGDSPQFHQAVDYADQQVGRIWDAIGDRQKNHNEDWLIIITTDHGRDSATGHNHGGQSDREKAGWIVTNAKNLNDHFKNHKSAITDIMPTIARFMGFSIPVEIAREVDGIPLTGPLSCTDLRAEYSNGKINLEWMAKEKTGDVKIWLATTNNFKTGGKDNYTMIRQVPTRDQKASIDVTKLPSRCYKIVVEAKHNNLGRWVILP